MEELSIHAQNLTKTYVSAGTEIHAVRGIDLQIPRGQLFGLIGPNGAGKTTTLGMLTTLIRPTAGTALVAGADVVTQQAQVKLNIGVASQNNTMDRQLTVAENLEFRGRFFGMPIRHSRRRGAELLELLGLADRGRAKVYELSGGQVKRLLIGRALMNEPQVLFLDEPTSGIDPQSRLNLWNIFRQLHDSGQTILLTTHHMEEAEALCERVAIIDHGKVLAEGSLAELTASTPLDTIVEVVYNGPATPLARNGDQPGVCTLEVTGNGVRVRTANPEAVLGELITCGAAEGLAVRNIRIQHPSLERVFLELTGKEYRE